MVENILEVYPVIGFIFAVFDIALIVFILIIAFNMFFDWLDDLDG